MIAIYGLKMGTMSLISIPKALKYTDQVFHKIPHFTLSGSSPPSNNKPVFYILKYVSNLVKSDTNTICIAGFLKLNKGPDLASVEFFNPFFTARIF